MTKSPILTIALSLLPTTFAFPLYTNDSSWSGWSNIEQLFVFGDSYTQTGFDPKSTQPNPSNPIGNPPYPGYTSSNGPNWVDFLTTTYNQSQILTYNLAYGGATVDSALVAPYQPTVISMRNQVQTQFLPVYGSPPASAPWTAESSLFAFWIGINDVGNSWYLNNTTLYDAIFSVYSDLLDQIYASGARNFLFLNVPPVNLSPLILNQNDNGYASEYEGKTIADWNQRVAFMAGAFEANHIGVTAFIYDTNALFTKVIKDPKSVEQTSVYMNVTGFCAAYQNGAPTWYTKDASCDYAVNEYLWLNTLHPTFPMHNATAAGIAALLE